MAASETISVPWFVLVCYAAAGDNLIALDTTSSKFILVATGTVNFLFSRNEALCTNGVLANDAAKTFLVPLSSLVFHLLGTSAEDLAASIAAACKLGIVTIAAINLVDLASKLFVHQRDPALVAEETSLVPVLVLVRQIL